jgi:hypothetical protein
VLFIANHKPESSAKMTMKEISKTSKELRVKKPTQH